jgi:hypothetical protein
MILRRKRQPQAAKRANMGHKITAGAILIINGAVLPDGLRLECEPCVPGWKIVTNLDMSALDREIRKTGWTFLSLAGESKATVFGIDHQKTLRRAIEKILERGESHHFNSLEITRVVSAGSGRFPLVCYVTVSAQWRHIQQGVMPSRAGKLFEPLVRASDIRNPIVRPAVEHRFQRLVA